MKIKDFKCPECNRLTSVPWRAAWCLHQSSNFQPMPPSHPESDWVRMEPVVSVQTESLPDVGWVVVEYCSVERSYKDLRHVVSEPMPQMQAREEALQRIEELDSSEPAHRHSFEAFPLDLVDESWMPDTKHSSSS